MKKTAVFGVLILFLFVGFRPPAGMRKLPVTNIQFEMQTAGGPVTAHVGDNLVVEVTKEDTQEEKE